MVTVRELLEELEQEAGATRRVLERVPESHLAWRPHARSFSLGQLALHVATTPGQVAEMAAAGVSEKPPREQREASSTAEVVAALEESLARAGAVLARMDDADLAVTWRMVDGGRESVRMPVGAVLRTIMLNHWYHHRGQLMVYLRMVGVPLPSVYGPTADENPAVPPAPAMAAAS